MFDGDFISRQLKSSGAEAFHELMLIGFPSKLKISPLFEEMKSFLKDHHIRLGEKLCCFILFSAIGFKTNEYKIGKTDVLVRPGKLHLLDKLHTDIKFSKRDLEIRFQTRFCKFMRNVLLARFRFLGKRKFFSCHYYKIKLNAVC